MVLLHAANLRHGTDNFTSLPKEGVLRIFIALKNPTASAGFEPANLGIRGQHATSAPPKSLRGTFSHVHNIYKMSDKQKQFLLKRNKIILWTQK